MAKVDLPTWAVHSTVAESPEIIYAFVAHYLNLGASEIHLCLDNPQDDIVATLGGMDRVRLTICDEAYWANSPDGRPDRIVPRQRYNATLSYRECQADWFLFCDADEYLYPERPFAEILAEQLPRTGYRRLRMAERFQDLDHPEDDIFAGRFRCTMDDAEGVQAVYGDLADLTTQGLTADVIGKSVIRTGLPYRIWIHFPILPGENRETMRKHPSFRRPGFLESCWLAHFDGFTPLHWQVKLLLGIMGEPDILDEGSKKRTPARRRQMRLIYSMSDRDAVAKAVERLCALTTEQIALLDEYGGMVPLDLAPSKSAQAKFASLALDYRRTTFDQRLAVRYPDLTQGLVEPKTGSEP